MLYRHYAALVVLAATTVACASGRGGTQDEAAEEGAAENPGTVTTGTVAATDTMAAVSQPRPMPPTAEGATGDTLMGAQRPASFDTTARDTTMGAMTDTTMDAMRADTTAGRTTGATPGMPPAGGDEAAAGAQLDSAITLVQGDITALEPAAATALIDNMRGFLSSVADPVANDIANDLDALKNELSKPTVDRQAVGQVLSRLGPKTTAAAPSAGALGERVARLGILLTQKGSELSR